VCVEMKGQLLLGDKLPAAVGAGEVGGRLVALHVVGQPVLRLQHLAALRALKTEQSQLS
jgi:hypothetical protein